MDPILLFFIFGLFVGLAKLDFGLPQQISDFVTFVLLLTIGLKGGVELAEQNVLSLLPQVFVVLSLGLFLPFVAYPILTYVGRLSAVDAASVAAHYGSVSVGTFAVAVAYLSRSGISYEPYLPLLVVLLEVPAIIAGFLLAKEASKKTDWKNLAREVFLGKSIVLLSGGLAIGCIAGKENLGNITPFFFNLFYGFLTLFLFEMGITASKHVASLKRYGPFLLGFGIAMPVFSGCVGAICAYLIGMSIGGTAMVAVLAASASYIAVPAAMKVSLPEANLGLSLGAALGVTFPFNVVVGIPLYYGIAVSLHGAV